MHIRQLELLPNRNFEGIQAVRMRMEERPRLLGLPLFLGYYWRGANNEEGREGGARIFDGLDPFTF